MASVPEKHVRTKSDEAFVDQGGTWDQSAYDHFRKFCNSCVMLETGDTFDPLPYQRDFCESVLCWKKPNGRRRVKLALLSVARKNGKTALTAALALYMLIADGLMSPSVVSCARDTEQSGQIFEALNWSIKNSPKLASCLVAKESFKEVHYPNKNGRFKSLSSTGESKLGRGHDLVIYDEMAFYQNDKLWVALEGSGRAKKNSLQVVISTAGFNRNTAYYRLYTQAKDILSGKVIDTTFMPWVYEVEDPNTVDLDSPKVWRRANPALDRTIDEDDFRSAWERAKRDTASKYDYYRLHFNSWTESKSAWLPVERWEACRGPFPDLTGAPCYVGIDAGFLSDLFALSAVYPVDGKFYVRSWGIAPRAAAQERDRQNLVSYSRFTGDGSLTLVDGNAVSIEDDVYPLVDRLVREHDVKSMTVDRWQLNQFCEHYRKRGVTVFDMPPTHYRFNEPTRGLERLVNEAKLVHDWNSLLRWQVGHAMLNSDNKGYVRLDKATRSQKVDNLYALVMALNHALMHGETLERRQTAYDVRPVTVF